MEETEGGREAEVKSRELLRVTGRSQGGHRALLSCD